MTETPARTSVTHGFLGAAGHASDLLGILEATHRHGGPASFVELYADGDLDLTRFADRPARFAGTIAAAASIDADLVWMLAAGYSAGREALAAQVANRSLRYATLVHPDATVGTNCTIGEGSAILARAALSPLVQLGRHVVVSQLASVGHDAILGDFSSVMPTAAVSGDCVLGTGAVIGAGAVVRETVHIGDHAVVGAGAVVIHDVEPGVVVVGCPAKPISQAR